MDKCLPAHFYKHAHNESRIKQYVKENPEATRASVNKKVKDFRKSE